MKKILIALCILMAPILFMGCSNNNGEANPKVSDIVNKMKEKMNETNIAVLEKEKEATTDEERKKILTEQIDELKKFPKEDAPMGMLEVDLVEDQNPITENGTISKDALSEGIMLESQVNIKADKVIILKAKDESSVQGLKEGLEKIKAEQEESWKTYLPDEYKKVQDGVIKTKGQYLAYIVSSDATELEKVFNDMVGGK